MPPPYSLLHTLIAIYDGLVFRDSLAVGALVCAIQSWTHVVGSENRDKDATNEGCVCMACMERYNS